MIGGQALVETDDLGVEEEGFFDVVGDGEDGNAEMGDVLLHAGEEGVSHGAIDSAEGLVEEEETGGGDGEGSGEVDALALAAGEVAGHPVGEGVEIEEGYEVGDRGGGWLVADFGWEADVLEDGEVGEEG